MVTGSTAGLFYGEPRMTHDVDIVLALRPSTAPKLVEAFPPAHFYCPSVEVLWGEIGRPTRGHFNLVHHDSGFRADIYLLGQDPLHHWAMRQRRQVHVAGEAVWLAPPEYVIVRKLQYYQEGESPKHLTDIAGIVANCGADLDQPRLHELIAEYHLERPWSLATAGAGEGA
jgi:hypothetical protein